MKITEVVELNRRILAYHVTPVNNIEFIQRDGLIPQIGSNSSSYGETEERLYFFPTIVDAEDATMNWLGDQYEEDILALLEVDITGINIRKDVDWELYTNQSVSPERIRVLSTDF